MGSSPLRIHMSMRRDQNFSLALDLKICNSLWASAIKLQDALRFTMPELFSDTHPVTSPKPESHSLLTILLLKNTEVRVFFTSIYFFWWGRGGERGLGEFLIHGLPFPHLLNKRPSLLRKTKTVTPTHDTKAKLMYPNQSRGSWNLFFNALFCFNIVQYSRVTATNTFISQTQFCGFSPLFFIRYRYHQIFFIQGRKR